MREYQHQNYTEGQVRDFEEKNGARFGEAGFVICGRRSANGYSGTFPVTALIVQVALSAGLLMDGFPDFGRLLYESGFTMSVTSHALRFVFVIAMSLGVPSELFGSQAELIGHWDGTMVREGVRLEVSFDFTTSGSQPKGTFTCLTQQVMDYPLALVTADSGVVHFVLGDSLVFDGKLGRKDITGTFTDDGAKGEFILRRSVPTTLPYDSVDVTFRNGDVTLAGTLCIPRSSGRHPAVVLLHGSGGETRWGTNRFIADRFARSHSSR